MVRAGLVHDEPFDRRSGPIPGYIIPVDELGAAGSGVGSDVRLRGRALGVASVVSIALLGVAVWAASVDLASETERNAAPLDTLAILYKLIAIAALLYVGWRWHSRSLRLLALLLALMAIGSLLVDMEWFVDVEHSLAQPLERALRVSSGFIELAMLFLGLAAVAGALVWAAYSAATPDDRPVVLRVIGILFVIGIFMGPVNAIASTGINREWLFAEDFGQVVSLAVLAGYGAGLVAATRGRGASLG